MPQTRRSPCKRPATGEPRRRSTRIAALPQTSPEPKPAASRAAKTQPKSAERKSRSAPATKKTPSPRKDTNKTGRKRRSETEPAPEEEIEAKVAKTTASKDENEEAAVGAKGDAEDKVNVPEDDKPDECKHKDKEESMEEGSNQEETPVPKSKSIPEVVATKPLTPITPEPEIHSQTVEPKQPASIVNKPTENDQLIDTVTKPTSDVHAPTPAAVSQSLMQEPLIQLSDAGKEPPNKQPTSETEGTQKSDQLDGDHPLIRRKMRTVPPLQYLTKPDITITPASDAEPSPTPGTPCSTGGGTDSDTEVADTPAEKPSKEQDSPTNNAPVVKRDVLSSEMVPHEGLNNGESVAATAVAV